MTSPLLLTKLEIPSIRSPLVKRDRLIEQLNRGRYGKLLLISATAGFGKTTLLSEWVQRTKIPVSWLSLDERDNDPTRFWTYVVAALQQTHHHIGEATLAMLYSTEAIGFESFLIPLINEIANLQEDIILVLDDYHLIIDRLIHDALTFLLEHLPSQLHLAIATRVDPPLPLARLRASNQLTELKAADLRFTVAEATAFFNQAIELPLSEKQVEAIQARTEGWIAGLQLAANAMRDVEDVATFVESLKGSQRYILDYLVEEVFNRQSNSLQLFLLRTSILERMCGTLCEAVVGEDISVDGIDILEQLERRNLFVVPLDRDRQWYRYHHLFRDLLQERLNRTEPERVAEYHYRAAQWYEQQNLVAEAIHHTIAAKEFHRAADLIEREAAQTTTNLKFEAARLLAWLEALPRELVWTRPWLLLSYGWALYLLGQFAAASVAMENLERLLKQQKEDTRATNATMLWGFIKAFKGVQARAQGAVSKSVVLMEQALQLLPQDNSWQRATILLNLGVTYFVSDNFERAERLLPEVTQIGQCSGIADPAIAGLYLQGQFQALRGRLDKAIAFCQQGIDIARERGWLATYAGVLVQVAMGEFLREGNQLEAAAQHLSESIDRGIQARQPGVMMGYITLARVRQAQGDLDGAWEAIRTAEMFPIWLWPTILSVPACKARLHLIEGNLADVIAWVEESELKIEGELRYSFTDEHPCGSELDYLTFARVLIARGSSENPSEPHLNDAMRLLDRLYEFAKAGRRNARVMEVLMLQALVWFWRGERSRAISVLEEALNIPHRGDYIRLFVDEGEPMMKLLRHAASGGIHPNYVSRLLAAFSWMEGETVATRQPLIEPLSDRELEVLHYLAMGLSNQAIAEQLFVSLPTVKWHARNIYGKLNVSNRTQAVARARELKILT
ncbi:LuxR family transcriptional regulator [Pleurocapsales cyanobacterium LEGE 06147]|nr:LuxR family transcriptional regulator [Pleurocapsales cyanobacterium LEGE 06147]